VDLIATAITVGATLTGVALGSVITWRLSVGQRKHEERVRREDRRYERLVAASVWLRRSIIAAAELDYTKSWRATIDVKVWGSKWRPFLEAIAEAGAAMALVRDAIDEDLLRRYFLARDALYETKGSDKEKLDAYTVAANALREAVDVVARPYANPRG
jgi:hypothetical protein